MENDHNVARERDQLKLLLDVSRQVINNFDVRNLCHIILENLRKVMDCDHTGLFLPDKDPNYLFLYSYDFPESKGVIKTGKKLPMIGSNSGRAFMTGKIVLTNHLDLSGMSNTVSEIVEIEKLHASCFLPLINNSKKIGVLHVARTDLKTYNEEEINFLRQIADQAAVALSTALDFQRVKESEEKLHKEKTYLEDELKSSLHFGEIIGNSKKLKPVIEQIKVVAPTDATVLIQGETGTGKELFARAIHNSSDRKNESFVKLNCAAIPLGLLESELFGHEKGAFTGAIDKKIGRFELADGGTLFLDEIGDIPTELQPKLLRVLQSQEFERLGSTKTISVNVRLVAATNKDLAKLVAEDKFRSDLFYRINVFPVELPPLRERLDDIPLLCKHFAGIYSKKMKKEIKDIPDDVIRKLKNYQWPGNIRELQNIIERAVILLKDGILNPIIPEIENKAVIQNSTVTNLDEIERAHIIKILQRTGGVVGGPDGAAQLLGLKRSTLRSRMEKLGISKDTLD
jgi:formate hydrogenlyase transcriptional activator